MPQLRIVVTGDTNSGKSTLSNAVIGRELLPTSYQSETSVITYVVPQQVGEECSSSPVLHCYSYLSGLDEQSTAEGEEAVRARLKQLNLTARSRAGPQCVECRLSCPLRDSLNVFVPPAAEWQDVQFLDIGGANEILNPAVQVCADLAYALSHRLIICIRYDQTTSRATQQMVLDIRAKAPYHFSDDLSNRAVCPLIFVITQADQALQGTGEELEVLRQSLRALLFSTLPDCVELTQMVPILVVSAKNSLENVLTGSCKPDFEWKIFEDLLINAAGLKRDIVQHSKVRRAAFIEQLLLANISALPTEAWPYNAECLWHSRKDLGIKIAIGSAVAAGSVGTALAFGVFLSASSAATVAAAEATAASAEATAAVAAANSWWAWAFGFGQLSAAATAATSAAATAEAAAVSAAATATAWGVGSAIAGVSTAGLSISAAATKPRDSGITRIAGMTVVHASAVRVKDVRMAFRAFKATAAADRIKAGKSYRDVLLYPEGTAKWHPNQDLGSLLYPFLLYNVKNSAYLSFDGYQLSCSSSRDRPGQLWWAVPDSSTSGAFMLQNADHLCNLRVADAQWFSIDRRAAVRCTPEVPGELWTTAPGSQEASIRMRNVQRDQCLFFDGIFCGAFNEVYPDQDWQVLPQAPFYIGGFKQTAMTGKGQFFWPNGAPLFKGSLKSGKLVEGFMFDERCICHGHFRFHEDGPTLEGAQPDDADLEGRDTCLACGQSPTIAAAGHVLKACGHGVICEACAQTVRDCPYCRSPNEGVLRVT